jgi:hypothetical protein
VKRVIERKKEKRHIIESMIVSHFSQFPEDEKAIISIERDVLTRSGAQNKLLWMWNKIIGDEIGHSKDDMHDKLVRKLLGTVDSTDLDGNITSRAIETKKLKVAEMKDYLEEVDRFVAEFGIILPRPEDLWWKSMGIKV